MVSTSVSCSGDDAGRLLPASRLGQRNHYGPVLLAVFSPILLLGRSTKIQDVLNVHEQSQSGGGGIARLLRISKARRLWVADPRTFKRLPNKGTNEINSSLAPKGTQLFGP